MNRSSCNALGTRVVMNIRSVVAKFDYDRSTVLDLC